MFKAREFGLEVHFKSVGIIQEVYQDLHGFCQEKKFCIVVQYQ